jgi:hypothetical protein
MPPAKKARMDFLAQVWRKYIGSGDPEISDAKDVVTYLSDKYQPNEFQTCSKEYMHKWRHSWARAFPMSLGPLSRMATTTSG